MSDEDHIRQLIERGSLGTPEAKAIRAAVSKTDVERVRARVRELEEGAALDIELSWVIECWRCALSWVIECWRCANVRDFGGVSENDARDDAVEAGWRMVKGFQTCPQCMGAK